MYIYRWDLDKTYLETDFDSLRGLVRSATEPAHAKRAVPGAAPLLRALSGHPASRVVVLSGSPTQMREVLAEKLRLDGVRFDELHLKDNLRNLTRGRLRDVRGQFGYKLPMLLRGRVGVGEAVRESLFGDDAEVDALVYSVFADAVAGRLRPEALARVMERAGAYPDSIHEALDALKRVSRADVVDRVFIHLERGVPTRRFEPLGGRVVPVHSWFQAALVLLGDDHLSAGQVAEVAREVLDQSGGAPEALINLSQDLARRGHLRPEVLDRLHEDWAPDEPLRALLPRVRRALDWQAGPRAAPERAQAIDYGALLSAFGRKESLRDA